MPKSQCQIKSQTPNRLGTWGLGIGISRRFGVSPRPRQGGAGAARRGFTLLEVTIATGIFSIIMIIIVGAMLQISKLQTKTQNIQDIQDNLRFALESMSKDIRTGSVYQPASAVSDGTYTGYTELYFLAQDGSTHISYCLGDGAIKKYTGGSPGDCPALGAAINSSAVVIDRLLFFIEGVGTGNGQPRTTISIRAHTRDPNLSTSIKLQTTIVQRLRDSNG